MADDGAPGDRRSGVIPSTRGIGRVIKGGGAAVESEPSERPALRPPQKGGVMSSENFEATSTAQKIVAEAEQRYAEIIAKANQEKDQIFEKAREDARAQVMAEASAEIAKAKMQAGMIMAGAENQIIELACRVAEKIIGKDLERDPAVVVDICSAAIENVRRSRSMILRVSPRDGQILREKMPKLMEAVSKSVDIAIKDDRDVKPGGCIIQTEFGTVDAQLTTQFEMLRLVLLPDTGKKEVK